MDCLSVALLLIVVLVSVLLVFFKKKFSYWQDRGANYMEPRIPMGNVPLKRADYKDFFDTLYRCKDSSPFVGGYMFTTPIVVPTSLDFIQNVLVRDFNSFHERGVYTNEADDPLSAHMFSLDGEKWKSLRNKLSPTFTSGRMKSMFATVVQVGQRLSDILDEVVKPKVQLDLKDLLGRFTTDVIGTCAFGIECNSLRDPCSVFRLYGKKVFGEPHLNMVMQMFVIQFPDVARKLHIRAVQKDVSEFFMRTVRETIAYREENEIRRNDFMDLLIQLKKGELHDERSQKLGYLTVDEIAAQCFLFFLAGFETTSTTMMYSLYELALNADIQDKAREEVNEILAKHEGELTYEAVKEMTYIEQIISETLRKYPPIVVLVRRCAVDFKVPESKATIERGTNIFIPAYSIHHDPDIYPEPEIFDPERFSQDQVKNRHPMAFLSFGDGPRNCIGLRFGRMQTKIGLITLLRNFRFRASTKTQIPMVFAQGTPILSPEGGLYLEVEKI